MKKSKLFELSPRNITALYLGFGILWIGTTDSLVVALFESPETITYLQTLKGWVFVVLSGFLIYGLTYTSHRQFETSQERLQTASEQLQVLHRVFRHNLRNDLNVIVGNIDIATRQILGPQEGDSLEIAKQKIDTIIRMSEKLRVVDSLDLNGTDSDVDLADITADGVETVRKEYPEVNISTAIPENAPVYGDHTISRAVLEVVENAVEHNPNPPEECEVSVEITPTNAGFELRVDDNGPTISEGELESIRTGKESDLVHMSGVGLWIVKWICECHGGTFEVEADRAEGTAVVLTFDRAEQYSLPGIDNLSNSVEESRTATA